MAARYNSPPGWPSPPEGWGPPPGWQPDPSWPAPPSDWPFWVDDAASSAKPAPGEGALGQGEQPTQALGQQQGWGEQQPTQAFGQPQPGQGEPPTQALPQGGMAQGGMPQGGGYSYAPSGGLEQPGQSPYAAAQGGGYPQGPGYPGSAAPSGSNRRNPTVLVIAAIVGVLLVGGLVWGVAALVRGGGGEEPTPTVAPTTEDPTTEEPTTEEPTAEEPSTTEPTDDPTTEDPTDEPTGSGGDVTDLTGSDPAIVLGASGDPIVEVRLVSVERDWEPSSGSTSVCTEPENGSYLLVELEYTTLDALSAEDPPNFTELELGVASESPSGTTEPGFLTGLFCGVEGPPNEMEPGETYTGALLLDVDPEVTAVTYTKPFDFMGSSPVYRWVLADQ